MQRTIAAKPKITKDLISHLFGRDTYLRELFYQGLTETPPDAFPKLDDGERLITLAVFTQSRRPGQDHHWKFGADRVYHPPWENQGFPAFVQAAQTPSQLLRPAYSFGKPWVYGKLNPHLSEGVQEDWNMLSGQRGKNLESRVDPNVEHLQNILAEYKIEELPAQEYLTDALREKPGSDLRISKLETLRRFLNLDKEDRNLVLAADFVEQMRGFEVFRRNLLEPASIPVSSERYSSLMHQNADPRDYKVLTGLPSGDYWETIANAYDPKIAHELKPFPRVYTEPALAKHQRPVQQNLF